MPDFDPDGDIAFISVTRQLGKDDAPVSLPPEHMNGLLKFADASFVNDMRYFGQIAEFMGLKPFICAVIDADNLDEVPLFECGVIDPTTWDKHTKE